MAKIVPNKVIAFNVPQTEHEVVRVQVDDVSHFYDKIHQHPEIQIMFIQSGEGTLIAGDYVGRFQAGDVLVMGSDQPHVFRCDPGFYKEDSILCARSISLYFSEKYFGKELWDSNEMAAVREFASNCRQGLRFIGSAMEEAAVRIELLSDCRGLTKMINFFSLLRFLMGSNLKKNLAMQSGRLLMSEEGRMNSIIEFTFRESHRKIYLSEVAQLANLSAEAFCRYFKLHTRKTYINFLNEVRVSHACQLLIQHDSSIQQVCYQCGFSNVSNFNRIFKKITAKTPLSFRKQLPFGK